MPEHARRLAVVLLVVLLTLCPCNARADPTPAAERPYGHPIAVCDLSALGAMTVGVLVGVTSIAAKGNEGVPFAAGSILLGSGVGVVTYEVCAPVVHVAHGRIGAAAGSLGLRILFPGAAIAAIYGLMQLATPAGPGDHSAAGLAVVPAMPLLPLAFAGASLIDANVLAHPAPSSAARLKKFAPTIARAPGGAIVGAALDF